VFIIVTPRLSMVCAGPNTRYSVLYE
jgi:hypothetical protein